MNSMQDVSSKTYKWRRNNGKEYSAKKKCE
jgi:hypothetical protein